MRLSSTFLYLVVAFLGFNAIASLNASAQDSSDTNSSIKIIAEGQEHIKLTNSGAQKFKLGDIEGGMMDFRKSVEIEPGYVKGFMNLGIAAYKAELYGEAAEAFTQVITLDSGIMEAYYYLPHCLHGDGEVEKAEYAFKVAIEMFPGNKDLFYYLALIYSQEDRKQEEIDVYSTLLENFPDEYKAVMNRGMLLNEVQDFDKAVTDFTTAIDLDPTDPEPRVLRGVIYINKGDMEKGCIDLFKAKELGDRSAAVMELIPMHCEN